MIRIRSGDTVTELAWTGENIPAARLLAQAGLYPDYPCGGQGRCGKCRVPVNGVKGRRGVGIDGVRVLSEFTRQIHLDQRGRRLVVLRKFDVLKPDALRFEPLARTRVLGRFSRAVGSFKYNEFSHVF